MSPERSRSTGATMREYSIWDWLGPFLIGCAAGFTLFLVAATVAFGQEPVDLNMEGHITGHAQYHEEYATWCQPGHAKPCLPSDSCCDARVVRELDDGSQIVEGHCYPTEFRPVIKDGVQIGWEGKYSPEDAKKSGLEWTGLLPEAKQVREKNPDATGRAGHLCTMPYDPTVLLCWRPSTGLY